MSGTLLRGEGVTVTAYDWVPDFAQGFVRDLRVRWAMKEAGFPYAVEILAQGSQRKASNLRHQPFGQVPALFCEGRSMFESGAIVWRIAEASEALMPRDEIARDACLSWVFGALNTMEEPANALGYLDLFAKDKEAAQRLRPEFVGMLEEKAGRLADALGERAHLVADRFTVADLMMAFVLRGPVLDGHLDGFPTLVAYVERQTARPAFREALEEQLVPFRENAPRYEAAFKRRMAQEDLK